MLEVAKPLLLVLIFVTDLAIQELIATIALVEDVIGALNLKLILKQTKEFAETLEHSHAQVDQFGKPKTFALL